MKVSKQDKTFAIVVISLLTLVVILFFNLTPASRNNLLMILIPDTGGVIVFLLFVVSLFGLLAWLASGGKSSELTCPTCGQILPPEKREIAIPTTKKNA